MDIEDQKRKSLFCHLEEGFLSGRVPHLYNHDSWLVDQPAWPTLLMKAPRSLYSDDRVLFNSVMRRIEEWLEDSASELTISVTLHSSSQLTLSWKRADKTPTTTTDATVQNIVHRLERAYPSVPVTLV